MFGASNENPLKNHESRNIFAAKGGKQSKLPSKDRKHVTKACEPCKGARAKCDGVDPCERCDIRNLKCIYSNNEDRRKKGSTQKRIQHLERENEQLNGLIRDVRSATDDQLTRLVSLIRSNPSVEDISARSLLLETGKEESSNSDLTGSDSIEVAKPSSSKPKVKRHEVFKVERLTDTPLWEVPAAPWTCVTDDQHLVSHLFSLWATWDNIFPDGIVLDYFLRDMQAQKIGCVYCSPFLANCVFAAGCLYSDYEETKTSGGKQSTLLDEFLDEAWQHLEKDEQMTPLTRLQGYGILIQVLSKVNKDREGWDIATRATNECAEMLRLGERTRFLDGVNSEESKVELNYALDVAIWGIFSMTTASYISYQRPQLLPTPPRLFPPPPTNLNTNKLWIPYHGHDGVSQSHLWEILLLHGVLADISREMSLELYLEREPSPEQARRLTQLERRLTAGYLNIPSYVKTSPAACYLRCWWLSIILTVVLHQHQLTDSKDVVARMLDVALEIVEICRLTCTICDKDKLHIFLCHPIYQALLILMDANREHKYDKELLDLLVILRSVASRAPWAIALLRMVQIDARHRSFKLPQAAYEIFEKFEGDEIEEWKYEVQRSRYPYLDGFSKRCKAAHGLDIASDMGEFLGKFDNLALQQDK